MKREDMYALACAASAAVFIIGTPLSASATDDKIEASFKQTYVYQQFLKDDVIRAEAKDGVVTLTGTVAEESHKVLAQATMASLPGVIRVDNQLVIAAGAAAGNADTWIARKVMLTLQFHRNVSAGQTAVEVQDGVVTLKGEAASTAQRELTAAYAEDIEGVKGVKNEMTVAATPEKAEGAPGDILDDASITAQVMAALMTHRSTRSVNARVATRNGEVTLTGLAKNAADRSLVARLVSDIRGVTSVKNQITVEEALDK